MTYIPNTRSRWNESPYTRKGQKKELNAYYEGYLNGKDSEFVAGYDFNTENAIENYFHNLAMYQHEKDGTESDVANIFQFIKETLLHYIEMNRDELIVSMIDGMDDEEYERIKAMVDREFLEQEGKTE